MENNLNLNCDIQTGENLDTVKSFTLFIHESAPLSTTSPVRTAVLGRKVKASAIVRNMTARRIWQRIRIPRDKTNWNLTIKLF